MHLLPRVSAMRVKLNACLDEPCVPGDICTHFWERCCGKGMGLWVT